MIINLMEKREGACDISMATETETTPSSAGNKKETNQEDRRSSTRNQCTNAPEVRVGGTMTSLFDFVLRKETKWAPELQGQKVSVKAEIERLVNSEYSKQQFRTV